MSGPFTASLLTNTRVHLLMSFGTLDKLICGHGPMGSNLEKYDRSPDTYDDGPVLETVDAEGGKSLSQVGLK